MDTKNLSAIQKKLEDERTDLEERLAQFSRRNPKNTEDFNANFPEIGDKEDENAAEVDTYSTNLTLERTLESALRDVQSALRRIAAGTYGVCKYCTKEIDPKRLLARPVSSACIDCKKRLTQEA
ncbi:hypothetical protein A3F28_02890 [Candidatus Uhrbacteria bacterium RIFCSPHIGHO2_12_FULL_57_11]|uniref:Zinc finger DksA/TraR C4-type domain-containing protein n=2 Tax=Candidatus Uhriibacteriota TaxID=1752732 RepID=A0A1F7UM42_9BACT|nr:MAG: hypothetical protein A3D72_04540 [Candidatus Uhrbacteria bacterium RIFCSPHIGHO2_02_FULL_57_19]OGL79305.1 MAG: hypothetical protein A3F28_02890 [Candidatus Uhrbacteria bacterium RIFCSPHIGHO2_12_FULL_57_11]